MTCGTCFWQLYCCGEFVGVADDARCYFDPPAYEPANGLLAAPRMHGDLAAVSAPTVPDAPQVDVLAEASRWLIIDALVKNNWVQQDAAAALRITPRKIHWHIRKWKLWHPTWRQSKRFEPVDDGDGSF